METTEITGTAGELAQHVEYTPWGEVFLEERNNTWNTPYLFNAKQLDEETGLYYFGARYYDPHTGLFISTDQMQERYPGISTYAYCNNNPLKYIDPTGMNWYAKDGDSEQGDLKWFDNKNGEGNEPPSTVIDKDGSRYEFFGMGNEEGGSVEAKAKDPEGRSGISWVQSGKGYDGSNGTGISGRAERIEEFEGFSFGGFSARNGGMMEAISNLAYGVADFISYLFYSPQERPQYAPQPYQGPYAMPAQRPQGSTPKPNEPRVVPQSIKPEVINPQKPSTQPIQRQDNMELPAINNDSVLREDFIRGLMRGVDSVHYNNSGK